MLKFCLIIWVLVASSLVTCSRILGIFPVVSVSHQIVYHAVVKELVRRGHELVIVTPNLINNKNLTNLKEIYMADGYDKWKKTFNFAQYRPLGYGAKEYTYALFEGMIPICEYILNLPEVVEMLADKSEHFHVVLVEWIFCPMMAAFSHRFNAPLIGITSFHAFITGHDNVGNPTHPVYTPDFFLPYSGNLNFWQRLYSTYYSLSFRWYYYLDLVPREDQIMRRYFGNDLPYLTDILNNLSLLLLNNHPVLGGPRPLVPTIIEFGGTAIHKKPNKPLPQDLQKYLDEAEEGAIYFSFGSNVQSVAVNEEKRNEILTAFSEMPYKFLWKWESDTLDGLPKNVKIKQWMPQEDILRHKNIKAFITQGGLQSFEEAVLHKVPLLAIPFFADQDYNVDRMVHLGIAVRLEINTLKKDQLKDAVYTIINNTKYKERITEISTLVHDQPMKSLDRAVWWIEYTIRHNGTVYLRSPVVGTPLYKYFLLDVILFVFFSLGIILYFLYKCYAFIINLKTKQAEKNNIKKNK